MADCRDNPVAEAVRETLEISPEERFVLTARGDRSDPHALLEAVRTVWGELAARDSLGDLGQDFADAFRAQAARVGLDEVMCLRPPRSVAYAVARCFRIERERRCLGCRDVWARSVRSWVDLRDALAPEALKGRIPSRVTGKPAPYEEVPDEGQIAEGMALCRDQRGALSWLDERLERCEGVLCPQCLERHAARARALCNMRCEALYAAEERARGEAERREAAEQFEAQNPPYTTVAAAPDEHGAAVSAWIRRGYLPWGPPLVCGERIAQALIRPGADREG